jgi:hypothetical protein
LTLRAQTWLLLEGLARNEAIRPATGDMNTAVNKFKKELDKRLDRWWIPTAAFPAVYVIYSTADALNGQGWPLTPLTWMALVVQAALLYVGVLAVAQVSATCWAIGDPSAGLGYLPGRLKVCVQPLHPGGCGGLWPIGHLLSLVLFAAAVIGGSSLCIIIALEGTPSMLTRRPEPYLLAAFYLVLLPLAFYNLLWRAHKLMRRCRAEILTLVAREFNPAVPSGKGSTTKATPGESSTTKATPGESSTTKATPGESSTTKATPGESSTKHAQPGRLGYGGSGR